MSIEPFNKNRQRFPTAGAIIMAAAVLILVNFAYTNNKRTGYHGPRTINRVADNLPNIKMNKMAQAKETSNPLSVRGELEALNLATGWINSKPLTSMDLKGKVVLINFWTYTCINWLRTLPYVRAWAQKYAGKGLVVIGVHTPEFSFEENPDNVRKLTHDLNVPFPVAMDNSYGIWNAFHNQFWPALYFIDAKGKIRHQQFGEGDYDQSENVIRQLLTESGAAALDNHRIAIVPGGFEAAPDWGNLGSPENYLGYQRTEHFASVGGPRPDRRHLYTAPETLTLNQWALTGDWKMQPESVLLKKPNGKIRYVFHARDLHMVMGPLIGSSPVRFRVLLDGHAPGTDHGGDIDEQGYGTLNDQRLYQLVRQKSAIENRHFEIEFFDAGIEAFSFTFG